MHYLATCAWSAVYTCELHILKFRLFILLSHEQDISIKYVLHPNQQTFLGLLSIFITATLLCVCTTQILLYSFHTFQVRLLYSIFNHRYWHDHLEHNFNLHNSPTNIINPVCTGMSQLQCSEQTFHDFINSLWISQFVCLSNKFSLRWCIIYKFN